jgi:hypothetical protein
MINIQKKGVPPPQARTRTSHVYNAHKRLATAH